MWDQIRKLMSLLTRRDKRNALVLLGMMLVGALLEVVGVAAIPAFVSAVVEPERVLQFDAAAALAAWLGLETTADFVIVGGIALLVVFAVKNAFLLLNYRMQVRYVANRRIALSRRLAHAYLQAPYVFHLRRNSAEIVRNVNREVAVLANQGMAPLLELTTRCFILVFVLGFLFVVQPWITLFWIAFLGIVGGIGVAAVSGRLRRYGQEEQTEGRQLLKALQQAFGGLKEAKVANREDHFAGVVASAVERIANRQKFKQFVSKATAPVLEVIAVTGLLALSAWLVVTGHTTEEMLVILSLFVVGLVRLREMLAAALNHLSNLRYSLVAVEPIHADLSLLERTAPRRDAAAAEPVPVEIRREVRLEDVWVRYDADREFALRGIDVAIDKGSAVGFVGSSGAGKSTLVDTLLALLEPERGCITVDGKDIRELGTDEWQAAIGYVPQSIYLLDDTIRRNIAFGIAERDIDDVAVQRAMITAQLQSFVETQPDGINTRVGERGVRLSGGERQRIGIARALYKDPALLVFDEATSALDNTTERAIIAAVEALKGTRTIVMVAHRLSTLRNCDVLHFLKDGRIEASGSFEELLDAHPEFRLMAAS